MQKSIRNNMSTAFTLIMALFVVFCFLLTFIVLRGLNLRQQKYMANAALDFSSITIDADVARDILATRIPAVSYTETQYKLSQYQRDNADPVTRISLISFSNSGGTYIYDTNGAYLGDKLEYDSYNDRLKVELINGRNEMMVKKGGYNIYYRPIRTVDDMLTGYVVVELRDTFVSQYLPLIAGIYAAVLLFGIILSRLIVRYIDRKLFAPMSEMTETLKSFAEKTSETDVMEYSALLNSTRRDEMGSLGKAIQSVFKNISNNTKSLSQALFDANHDGMTRTLNKRYYHSMEDYFRKCNSICVIYFDVNNLKLMNDTLGHESGDQVIKHAADYIMKFKSDNDYCFRMGGDEFLFVMTECTYRKMDKVIEKIEADEPYLLNRASDSIKCALSYGYAYAKGSYDYEALLAEAEEKMYEKKTSLKELLQMPDR